MREAERERYRLEVKETERGRLEVEKTQRTKKRETEREKSN